ncbi:MULTISPECIES: hypothetical protein [Streptomyces]|uniref:Uncharacterized protein n=1 Tax=Streptomyces caniscabiei TaxID=2746961 RepID=A0ABU4MLB3_9ACTN|nr:MULTISPECIES: hypothetical protein [Streptomyces]MBE4739131.1 hypothetical protein [Streptomyces caniscabiei]MBE4758514.1 hypothetical protein [Streptomyces caniscabiei]MBE4771936.1 hypothetical protein [Streptomyces caniscabiei]MBE4787997.1 hypothetical protein [Streptomyces caniscabiei]MBE4797219.1 hypothetical protein [Streptomyces caniscabiei]
MDLGYPFQFDAEIRHHEHDQTEFPTDAAIDYLFVRLASLISLVLRSTGRMTT